jgi:membrane protein CcdC involved in cytochrome C biogenesis
MKKSKLFWVFLIALILLRIIWSLPIGRWLDPIIDLSSVDMLVISILTILFWVLVYWYLRNRRN